MDFTFYVLLVLILPMWCVVIICLYMGVGDGILRKTLGKQGTTPSAIAQGFLDCLKFHALKIFWPVTIRLLR